MLAECRPQNNLQSLDTLNSNSPQELITRHHREKRAGRGKKVRKARKNRKNWNDINDADLYKYIQLRSLFRFVAYHPAEEE